MTSPAAPLDRIVLGLTGGIAAYKSAELTRLFVKAGVRVDVVMTAAACRFITPMTLQALSGRPVLTDLWTSGADNGMGHIDLSRGADAIVVAPASADFLAKLAHGHADDLLSTLCAARDCPLLVAPAMNRQMWGNPANRRNVERLAADGVAILGPDSGDQACGETGEGRMLEPEAIFAAVIASRQPKLLAGKRVLLTAGPTFERIDPVRGITNSSSGRMGYALAQAAAEAGAAVTLVSGPTALPTPPGVARVDVESAAEMLAAVLAHVAATDLFVAVAAVADYTPAAVAAREGEKARRDALDRAETHRRHPGHRRRAPRRAVLRRLRGGEPRRRPSRRRKAPAQGHSADHRQSRAGRAGTPRQRGHAARRRRPAPVAADGQAGTRAAPPRRDRRPDAARNCTLIAAS